MVFTCLPSTRAIETVVAGERGLVEGFGESAVWIDNSTNDHDLIVDLAARLDDLGRGIRTIEAPCTGGVHLAKTGGVTVILGGEAALVERFMPLFKLIGNRQFHVGDVGQASKIKAITNMLAFIHLVADGEAMMLAKKAGIDLGTAWQVIQASSGNSFVHETEGQVILSGSYMIDLTFDLALKDLGFNLAMGEEYGVPLELATAVRNQYLRATERYGADAQSPEIVRLLEDACGTELRAPGFPERIEA